MRLFQQKFPTFRYYYSIHSVKCMQCLGLFLFRLVICDLIICSIQRMILYFQIRYFPLYELQNIQVYYKDQNFYELLSLDFVKDCLYLTLIYNSSIHSFIRYGFCCYFTHAQLDYCCYYQISFKLIVFSFAVLEFNYSLIILHYFLQLMIKLSNFTNFAFNAKVLFLLLILVSN